MNGVASWFKQHQHRVTHKLAIISFCLVWLIWVCAWHTPSVKRTLNIPEHDPTPLVTRYIEDGRGDGGSKSGEELEQTLYAALMGALRMVHSQ